MHFLLCSSSCVPDISNFFDMLFNMRLFLTVLHLDSKSVFEGVAVDEGTAFDGCGAALPVNISFHIFGDLGTDGCGPALLNDFLVLGNF